MKHTTTYAAVLLVSCVCVEGVGPQTSWSRPDAPLDVLYDKFFKDLDSVRPCVGMNVNEGPSQCYADHSTAPLYLLETTSDWDVDLKAEGGMWNVIIGDHLPKEDIIPFLAAAAAWNNTIINSVFMKPMMWSELPNHVGYSPQPVRPSAHIDLYNGSQPAWNPNGGGLWEKKLPLILFMMESDHADAVKRATRNKDKGYGASPQESMQVNYVMKSRGKNSTECIKSGECDVMGKASYWSTTISTEQMTADTRYVGVALPISGTSLFTELMVPAQGAVMGSIVAALAFADAISGVRDRLGKQILFMFFDAELYGSAGSFRFFKDIINWECLRPPEDPQDKHFCLNPNYRLSNFTHLNHENIDHLIALDQLGVVEREATYDPASPDMYLYYDGVMYDSYPEPVDKFINAFTQNGARVSSAARYLPPSPAQSYLRINSTNRERATLGVGVFAGYDGAFNNKYYGSSYDTADLTGDSPRLNVNLLINATTALTNSLWTLAEATGPPPAVNESLIDELLTCLGGDINCPLVLGYLDRCYAIPQQQKYPHIANMYPGLSKDGGNVNPVARFIFNFMADRMAVEGESSMAPCLLNRTCPGYAPCSNPYEICVSNFDGATGTCKLASIFAHSAVTPALFVNNQSKWDFDPRFSYLQIWTESVWQSEMGSRLFTSDSNIHEVRVNK
eukprot:TRINITY_DN10699_c0_g1_i1.p1 TRINITY_DN10699_c0_g1~~TRINITY_DN10699_c0_g1_i1.p1  ORF type:complete len:688 (+),score=241.17 TRINITY_DN10699_c0_g1_i1:36-2066(+)